MGTTRRTWLVGASQTGALTALALAGCGQTQPAAGRLTAAPVTLRVTSAANEMGEMAASRYPAFTAQHPNVTVQFEDTPDYSAKLVVLAAAGGLGDLAMIYLSSGAYHYLAPNGALVDHTPLAARDRYDLKQFYAAAVDAVRLNSKVYGP